MLVYRNEERVRATASAWAELTAEVEALASRSAHDDIVAAAIDLGEIEAAVADRLFPRSDGIDDLAQALRHASLAAAQLLIDSWRGARDALGARAAALVDAIHHVPVARLPPSIAVRPSAGYASYALHPESYAASADALLARTPPPPAVVAIGIRGIGTSLSAVVAAESVRRGIRTELYSVRPHGHPLDRRVTIREDLAAALRRQPWGALYLIVDEGPGLSGSSFASVADALLDLGIAADAIILFPGSNPDGSQFESETAQRSWRRHRRCAADEGIADARIRAALDAPEGGIEVSAGAWREYWAGAPAGWPAVHPQHERRKMWSPQTGMLVRFAGLGHYGAARLRRARMLADAGLGPFPDGFRDGYLRLPFIRGTPCSAADGADRMLVSQIGAHVGFLARHFPSEDKTPLGAMEQMVERNVGLAIGDEWVATAATAMSRRGTAIAGAPGVEIDGRILPHEWLRTAEGFQKLDALDHHADHFFPGVQDAAWDLAAAAIEFNLTREAVCELLAEYIRASGDRDVAARLPWHRLAYLAFRTGYVTLAAEALGNSADGRRFKALRRRQTGLLRQELALTSSEP